MVRAVIDRYAMKLPSVRCGRPKRRACPASTVALSLVRFS